MDSTKAKRKLPFDTQQLSTSADVRIQMHLRFQSYMAYSLLTTCMTCLLPSSDNEFAVECISVTKAEDWHFTPLSKSSIEELGPLVHITKCSRYPQYVIGGKCI